MSIASSQLYQICLHYFEFSEASECIELCAFEYTLLTKPLSRARTGLASRQLSQSAISQSVSQSVSQLLPE